jgi:hypothetical protein
VSRRRFAVIDWTGSRHDARVADAAGRPVDATTAGEQQHDCKGDGTKRRSPSEGAAKTMERGGQNPADQLVESHASSMASSHSGVCTVNPTPAVALPPIRRVHGEAETCQASLTVLAEAAGHVERKADPVTDLDPGDGAAHLDHLAEILVPDRSSSGGEFWQARVCAHIPAQR